jgi:undecaprenyl-diphosphatase
MDFFTAIILGIVEGLTEFLPISSTGHLILASKLLQLMQTDFVKSFEIAIQLGAIISVVVLYWKKFFDLEILKKLFVAFLPTAAIGFILYKTFKQSLLGNEQIVLWSLLLGGVFIILFEFLYRKKGKTLNTISEISYKKCFLIGIFQSFSIIPGVSRAAATIIGGLSVKLKRETIVQFSFLLAVPTLLAATGFDLINSATTFSLDQIDLLAMGFVASFFVALAAVKLFLNFARKNNFIVFGIYRIIIALVFWFILLK